MSDRTVFSIFPTKMALLNEAIDVAIVGDDHSVPAAERTEFRSVLDEPDARRALERFVAGASDLFERAGALIMAGYESAGTDTELREASKRGDQARAKDFALVVDALAGHDALRGDLSLTQATDLLMALVSPQVHQMLRRHRGRSAAQYRSLILDTLERALLA